MIKTFSFYDFDIAGLFTSLTLWIVFKIMFSHMSRQRYNLLHNLAMKAQKVSTGTALTFL
jgi:hypothetical protein